MMKSLTRYATTAALLMAGLGCSEDGSSPKGPITGGGRGGSAAGAAASGASGSAGNPAGSGGAGGSEEPGTPDAGGGRFLATLQGEIVSLDSLDPAWWTLCRGPQIIQRTGDEWTRLQDDRPEAFNLNHAAHYVDGVYHSDCRLTLGCDVDFCTPFPEDPLEFGSRYFTPLVAREYVQVGQRAAPDCEDAGVALDAGGDAGSRLVPDIESRVPGSPIGVRVRYYLDSRCQTEPITTDVPVE
jgi:hypothetical protein